MHPDGGWEWENQTHKIGMWPRIEPTIFWCMWDDDPTN